MRCQHPILQVALHYVSSHEVWVTFVTGSPQTGVGVPPEQAPDQQPHPPHVSLTRAGDSMARTVPACVPALPLLVHSWTTESAHGEGFVSVASHASSNAVPTASQSQAECRIF